MQISIYPKDRDQNYQGFPSQTSFGQCEGNQAELDAIKLKYESKYKNVEKRAKDIENDAPDPDNDLETTTKVDFDFKMQEQHFALDLVSVTMKAGCQRQIIETLRIRF